MEDYDDVSSKMILGLFNRAMYRQTGKSPEFTQEEMVSLRLCWNDWVAGDPAKRGFELFLRMFKMHPETQKVFEFARGTSSAQMQNSSRLFFHVTRVINKLTKCVENLENLEDVVPMLVELGSRHGETGYNVPSQYFPHLGKALRQLMSESVKPYNQTTDASLQQLYDWIIGLMVEGQHKFGKRFN